MKTHCINPSLSSSSWLASTHLASWTRVSFLFVLNVFFLCQDKGGESNWVGSVSQPLTCKRKRKKIWESFNARKNKSATNYKYTIWNNLVISITMIEFFFFVCLFFCLNLLTTITKIVSADYLKATAQLEKYNKARISGRFVRHTNKRKEKLLDSQLAFNWNYHPTRPKTIW